MLLVRNKKGAGMILFRGWENGDFSRTGFHKQKKMGTELRFEQDDRHGNEIRQNSGMGDEIETTISAPSCKDLKRA